MVRHELSHDLSCPFIENNDTRCGGRFTLARLNEAFGVCVNGGYLSCPAFRQMIREQQSGDAHTLTIDITIEGRHRGNAQPTRRLAV